jgi:hypothetical protein
MSYGLQVFDSSGGITLDTDDRLMRFYGKVTGSQYCSANVFTIWYIYITGLEPDGNWFIYPTDIWLSWVDQVDMYTIESGRIKIYSYGLSTGRTVNAAFLVYKK